ncbi:ABC transporter ATP-binding protein [Ktedonosporobacter rubrisoli]|uniref:ABC-type quaternary amine transporter n=1 Tax=Ktedonosporobacter rubrisoli TaxID=2509675 RepID=A0A4P6JTQ5_KTERU|nr:ABC transporter ATP-binding protein [Ktedonosporobacter rubrisoli]QBD78703.1 ABC transporter ATP-binding protein [Ktedonosporobacter rubrisoli]
MAQLVLENISKRLGNKLVVNDLNLEVRTGEMVCLLGASGCGKTTTLRMIAGFLQPDTGRILLDGAPITNLPAERRPTAMVFQQYALWPHMNVFNNIAFGLKLRKLSKATIQKRVQEALELVRLEEFTRSYPAQLSGGQQQRVALARAIVLEPQLLLLDEPLSNLDAKLREQVREEIQEIQRRVGITTIFVTHDQDEAMSISDHVAVLAEGRLVQYDPPAQLYRKPLTTYVAGFVGAMNLLRGSISREGILLNGQLVPCQHIPVRVEGEVDIAVRPEDVRLVENGGALAQVKQRIPRGHYQELVLETPAGNLRSFISNDISVEAQVRYIFQRVLVYQNGSLLQEESYAQAHVS